MKLSRCNACLSVLSCSPAHGGHRLSLGVRCWAGAFPHPRRRRVILFYELLILSPGPFPPDSLASSGCV